MHNRTEDPLYHPVVIKDKQRLWKRILIVDDDEDISLTFKAGIEDNNNKDGSDKRIVFESALNQDNNTIQPHQAQ
ncbi:MAG: hypothetical protein WA364_10085 [Candidatus Nitrosopolaris sp.]